jgi:DNA-binding SARP family transcriptional activator/tetratricopeptide (TPR) repeat protein
LLIATQVAGRRSGSAVGSLRLPDLPSWRDQAREVEVEYRVLGPVEVLVDGRPVALGGPKPRALLTLLLLNANRVVPTARLIEALWGGRPPASGATRVQGVVSQLRASLAEAGAAPGPITTHPQGYLLKVADGELDLDVFERRRDEGRAASGRGDPAAAAAAYRAGLGLWRGPALSGVDASFAETEAARLEECRLAAVEDLTDAELALGRHAALVSELTALVRRHPLRERPRQQLMLALYRSGRQAEALEAYQEGRRLLVEELGLEPGPGLQRLQRAILAADPGLRLEGGPSGPDPPPASPPAPPVTPSQLPADVAGFVGRAGDLRRLDALLPDRGDPPTTAVPVALVTGTAGVGKTALAVHWAHRVGGRFADGHLYLDLRGWSATAPVRPTEALRQLLHGLGADRVPAGLEEAAGQYRSLTAGRRLLVVLDNAASADQVRPLLPGSPGCLVVVTSRDRLAGLVASHGARRVVLDPLRPEEAEALLAEVVGAERVEAEPEAAAELAGACAHLPLALRIAAANLADDPHQPIAGQVAALREGDRLAALEIDGDPGAAVRAAFDASHRRLAPPERRLFGLLGLVPGPHVTAGAAAALAGGGEDEARGMLGRLAAAHLVDQYVAGRYRLHDLLRLYAAERALEADERERLAATRRLLAWYLHGADEAARLLYPEKVRLPAPGTGDRPGPARFADRAQALAWLDVEAPNLVAAVRHAADHGPRPLAWLLADTLRGYFWLRVPAAWWLDAAGAGLSAAVAEDDPRAKAAAELSLGDLHWHRTRYPEAVERYTTAVGDSRRAGWPEGEAAARGNLGLAHWRSGRLPAAVEELTRSLDLARRTGWRSEEVSALGTLGAVSAELGLLEQAAGHFTAALALTPDAGPGRAGLLDGLGEISRFRGRLDQALDQLSQALAMFGELGNRGGQADTLRNLAAVHADAGRYDRAAGLARQALELARQIGSRLLEAGVSSVLGDVEGRLGRHRAALDRCERARRLAREARTPWPEAEALLGLAGACRHLDRPDLAAGHAGRALELAREAGYRMLEGQAETCLAEVRLATGRPDLAAGHARRALAIQRQTGARLGEARACRALGVALRDTEGPAAAAPPWRDALAIFTAAGAAPEADALRDLLGLDR